jgi:hypothetical protein
VLRDPRDAAEADVLLVRRDPFADAAPLRWPDAAAEHRSLWESIPIGVDEEGERVAIDLVERNVLIGGEPGAGKSVALSTVVAAAALDPGARIWLLDGSSSSWPRGRRSRSVSQALMPMRRSSCCEMYE